MMMMKKLLVALMLLLPVTAHAQKTKSALTTEVNANLASGNQISISILRTTLLDMVNSWYDLNGGSTASCASHTFISAFPTLSSQTCTQPVIADISGWGTNVAAALGNTLNAAGGLVGFNSYGTGVATALGIAVNSTGAPLVQPSTTRAGDIFYWNGSTLVSLAGNNSGTQTLTENASGVPAWATVSGTGTVTSVQVIGAGLAVNSGTCTITTSGVCTITVTAAAKTDQQTATSNILAVTPLHQQDHPSATKAWAYATVSGGVVTLAANYNVQSITRTSAGIFTVNFNTSFASTNYACHGDATAGIGTAFTANTGARSRAVGSISLDTNQATAFANADPLNFSIQCVGSQ